MGFFRRRPRKEDDDFDVDDVDIDTLEMSASKELLLDFFRSNQPSLHVDLRTFAQRFPGVDAKRLFNRLQIMTDLPYQESVKDGASGAIAVSYRDGDEMVPGRARCTYFRSRLCVDLQRQDAHGETEPPAP